MERIWQSDQHRFSILFEIHLKFEIIIADETVLCEVCRRRERERERGRAPQE